MFAFFITACIVNAATQPDLYRKVFRHDETYLDFNSSNKGVYSYSEGGKVITRNYAWNLKFLYKRDNHSDGPVYEWQLTVNISMSYGTKKLVFYIKSYENGSIRGDRVLCSDGKEWKIV